MLDREVGDGYRSAGSIQSDGPQRAIAVESDLHYLGKILNHVFFKSASATL